MFYFLYESETSYGTPEDITNIEVISTDNLNEFIVCIWEDYGFMFEENKILYKSKVYYKDIESIVEKYVQTYYLKRFVSSFRNAYNIFEKSSN